MRGFFGFLAGLCFLSLVIFLVVSEYNNVSFGRNVSGYLKRAADSNSIELAQQNLATAVTYLDRNGLTSGTTSALWTTPGQDVGFWYANLTSALKDLRAAKPDTSPLERSNMLIKLRETLLDHEGNGDTVTVPSGISIYPNNVLFFWWGWLSLIIGVICGIGYFVADDRYY